MLPKSEAPECTKEWFNLARLNSPDWHAFFSETPVVRGNLLRFFRLLFAARHHKASMIGR